MTDVLLDSWDCIELFCRVVSREKKIPLKEFQSNDLLRNMLEHYARRTPCKAISKKVYQEAKPHLEPHVSKEDSEMQQRFRTQKMSEIERSFTQSFYNLVECIRFSRPFYTRDYVFNGYCRFIRKKDFASDTKRNLERFSVSFRQRSLEDTKWWLYFYDELTLIEQREVKTYKGVSRALLHIKPFGKAELIRYKTDADEPRIYTGTFRTSGHDKYLSFKMKLKNYQAKDLRMLFYIGTDEQIELALGLSGNVSESLWARTVLIDPIKESNGEDLTPRFFSKALENEQNKTIPDYIWLYFADRFKNMLKAPQNITTIARFYDWYKKANDSAENNAAEHL